MRLVLPILQRHERAASPATRYGGRGTGARHHAEVIPDLLHVHPGAIRVALRSIAGLYCVTDSTAAAGMPDGEYRLGRQLVTRCMGGASARRHAGGLHADDGRCLAQSGSTHWVCLGGGIAADVHAAAADYIGATQRGRLVAGAFADMVCSTAICSYAMSLPKV